MSDIRFNRWLHQSGTGGVYQASSGNVGVGTSVPSTTLDVNGSISATSITATTGTITGNLSIGGVLSYEDVTNIDSVGIITARSDVSIADKIVHTGDTNTAIRFPAVDTFTVETAGSERLRITSDGKIVTSGGAAVGTVTLAGDGKDMVFGRTQNSGTGGVGRLVATGNIVYLQAGANASSGSAADLVFGNYGGVGERVRVDSAGNVGINETTPDSKIDIVYHTSENSATANLIHLRADPGGSYVTRGLFVKIGRDGNYDNSAVRYDIVGSAGNSGFHAFEVQGDEKLRITKDGKMGLGTQTPGDKLSISGGSLGIYNTGNNHGNVYFYKDGTAKGWLKYRGNDDKLVIGNVTDAINVKTDGSVGVGNADPTQAKFVAQTSSGMSIAAVKDNTGASISLGGATQPRVLLEAGASASQFKIYTAGGSSYGSASWAERLRINENGCLQVGEPNGTPSEVMQIRKASGDVEVISYAAPGSKSIFNCTGSNRFALERGYNSVFEIQDPNGNGVRSDLRFDGNIILNKNMGELNNSAVQLYRLIGPQNLSLGSGMAIVGGQTDTISTKAARIMTSNNNGTAWFGPYGTIHPGSYTAMFHMKVSNNSNTNTIIRIDVSGQGITDAGGYGDHRPRSLNLAPSHFDNADRYQYIGLDFNFVNPVASNIIEVRGLNFNNSRSADLYLDHILIVPRIPSHDG